MEMDGTKIPVIPVNGHSSEDESRATIGESRNQAPLIDDSLIADDDEGLPLISAVFSLAADGKTDEASFSGGKVGVSNPISTTSSSQMISLGKPRSLHSSSPIKSCGVEIQSQRTMSSSERRGNSTTTNGMKSVDVTSDSQRCEQVPQVSEARTNTGKTSGETSAATIAQSTGNMVRLVKLVNSVSKVNQPQAIPPLASKVSPTIPTKPGAHLPRQIAMKQPTPGSKQTNIVLNLKPGEPIPKAINLLGADGKSMVLLTLSEGGKHLLTPSGAPVNGGKIVIPIPSSVSATSTPAPKKITLVNKIFPIAPHPAKTIALPSQGILPSPVITSVTGSAPQKPVVVSRPVDSTRPSSMASFSYSSESRVLVTTPVSSSNELGSSIASPSIPLSIPTKIAPMDPKPSSSDGDKSTGLSPQEAKIQRLKELIKRQEDAVNKLREKRRLEIERIRDPSLPSKVDEDGVTSDSLKSDISPSAEQKRPASPFAVPLPPKRRLKECESSSKTIVSKDTDSAVTPSDGAFIPNGDDRTFVQLVGLEKVVKSIT